MLSLLGFMRFFALCATMIIAQQASAAVVILEGKATSTPPPPPLTSAPEKMNRQEELSAPGQTPSPQLASPPDSQTLPPAIAPAATASPALENTSSSPPVPPISSPNLAVVPSDLGTVKVANSAEVAVEMMPGQTVNVGSRVSFRITSKKPGYLVLVDVDATGHLTQIYPNTASLIRANNPKGNYVKPGSKLMIPLAADPYAGGVEYVVSPPSGQAMIVAILSAQPVQILDLPDVPPEVKDQSDRLAWLAKWTRELRIPDDATNQLREAQWSFNAKPYIIQ
jgi:hypothetical protein